MQTIQRFVPVDIRYEWKYRLHNDDYNNRLYSQCLVNMYNIIGDPETAAVRCVSVCVDIAGGVISIKGERLVNCSRIL